MRRQAGTASPLLLGLRVWGSSVTDPVLPFTPEKKSRKRKAPACPPLLLLQDLETTGRQTEDRVAQLFAEEMELSSTPPLPASRILQGELEKAGQSLQPPGGKKNFLWEGSALTGAWALEAFYTTSLVPPLVPQRSAPAEVCPPLWVHSGLWGEAGSQDSRMGHQQKVRKGRKDRKSGVPAVACLSVRQLMALLGRMGGPLVPECILFPESLFEMQSRAPAPGGWHTGI